MNCNILFNSHFHENYVTRIFLQQYEYEKVIHPPGPNAMSILKRTWVVCVVSHGIIPLWYVIELLKYISRYIWVAMYFKWLIRLYILWWCLCMCIVRDVVRLLYDFYMLCCAPYKTTIYCFCCRRRLLLLLLSCFMIPFFFLDAFRILKFKFITSVNNVQWIREL